MPANLQKKIIIICKIQKNTKSEQRKSPQQFDDLPDSNMFTNLTNPHEFYERTEGLLYFPGIDNKSVSHCNYTVTVSGKFLK